MTKKQTVKATKIINMKTGKNELEEDLTKWMHPDMRKKPSDALGHGNEYDE